MANLLSCPNCEAVWSMEEIEEQYCDACGYPHDHEAPEPKEPDLMGPDADEFAERMHKIQRDLK